MNYEDRRLLTLVKKIIFFDGDGTLWYPKATKYAEFPWLIYKNKRIKNPNKHLVLTPTALSTIKTLKKKHIILIVLSTHPHPPKEADALIKEKIRHFKLKEFFDEIHATPNYHRAKAEFMLNILRKRKLRKSQALMVGDSINHDYRPAKSVGIDALLIDMPHVRNHPLYKKFKWEKIKKVREVLKYV